MGQSLEMRTEPRQTRTEYLAEEKHQVAHGRLGDENFGKSSAHCSVGWIFPGTPGTPHLLQDGLFHWEGSVITLRTAVEPSTSLVSLTHVKQIQVHIS